MKNRKLLNTVMLAMLLFACASPYSTPGGADADPINLIPMYGYPDIEKTPAQKQADAVFVQTVTKNHGSHQQAAMEFAGRGWYHQRQGDSSTAMKRFNQSWLLDPDSFWPYWGFSVLLYVADRTAEALPHYERAIALAADDHRDKPRLLLDAANAYAKEGKQLRVYGRVKSAAPYARANALVAEARRLGPYFVAVYRVGARIYYEQGNYEKAWELVNSAPAGGEAAFDYKFLDELSEKMPNPQ